MIPQTAKWLIVISSICLVLGYGIIANIQNAVGLFILQQTQVRIFAISMLVLSLIGARAFPSKLGSILFSMLLLSLTLLTAQQLIGESSSTSYIIEAANFAFPILCIILAIHLRSLKGVVKVNTYLLSTAIVCSLVLGIVQWITSRPIVWTGDSNLTWQPIIWQGEWQGNGSFTIRAFGPFISPVYFGMVAGAVAIMSTISFLYMRRNLIIISTLLISYLALYASLNRTLIFGVLIALCLIGLLKNRLLSNMIIKLFPVMPILLTFAMLITSPLIALMVDAGYINNSGFARTLIIRLQDYPDVLSRAIANPVQLLIGTNNIENFTQIKDIRTDGVSNLPIDNEILYFFVRFGFAGPIVLVILLSQLLKWLYEEWISSQSRAVLAAIGCVFVWGVGLPFNVLYGGILPIIAILILISKNELRITGLVAQQHANNKSKDL